MGEMAGLEMTGLSDDLKEECRGIYQQFLNGHRIHQWPLNITVVERALARQYKLVIECVGRQWSEKITTSPGDDLRRKLKRFLEIDYLQRQGNKSASGQ